jgi:hypothetical protein
MKIKIKHGANRLHAVLPLHLQLHGCVAFEKPVDFVQRLSLNRRFIWLIEMLVHYSHVALQGIKFEWALACLHVSQLIV